MMWGWQRLDVEKHGWPTLVARLLFMKTTPFPAHLQLEGLFQVYYLRFSSRYEKPDYRKMVEGRGGEG